MATAEQTKQQTVASQPDLPGPEDDYESDYLSDDDGQLQPQQAGQRRRRRDRYDGQDDDGEFYSDEYDDDDYSDDDYSDDYSDDDQVAPGKTMQPYQAPKQTISSRENDGAITNGALNTVGSKKKSADEEEGLKLKVDVNLDIEVELKARIHGDLTLSLLA